MRLVLVVTSMVLFVTRQAVSLGAAPDKAPSERQLIQRVLTALRPEIEGCYREWLRFDPSLSGRIGVSLRIVDSAVELAQPYASSLNHPLLEGCILNAYYGARFPELRDELLVEQPLVLARNGEDVAALDDLIIEYEVEDAEDEAPGEECPVPCGAPVQLLSYDEERIDLII